MIRKMGWKLRNLRVSNLENRAIETLCKNWALFRSSNYPYDIKFINYPLSGNSILHPSRKSFIFIAINFKIIAKNKFEYFFRPRPVDRFKSLNSSQLSPTNVSLFRVWAAIFPNFSNCHERGAKLMTATGRQLEINEIFESSSFT